MLSSIGQGSSRLKQRFGRVAAITLGVGSLVGGLTVVAGVTPAGAVPAPLYVASTGSNTANNCQSKAAPCLTLKYAYGLSVANQTINLAGGTFAAGIDITHNLTIAGVTPGGSLDVLNTTINGGEKGTVAFGFLFETDAAVVKMSNMVISGDNNTGGGIYNIDGLTLTNVNVENNTPSVYSGGGIQNRSGTLVMTGGKISGNSFADGGGLYNSGTATLDNVALNHDTSFDVGGAIYNYIGGTLNLTGTTAIHNNSASYVGGGIYKCTGTTMHIGPSVSVTANAPDQIASGAC